MGGAPRFPRRDLRRWAALAACVLLSGGVATVLLERKTVYSEEEPRVAPEVLEALRLLLSSDPREEARGEFLLERMGASAVPHLRFWVHKVRRDADRVTLALSKLEGGETPKPSLETVTASEFLSRKMVEARMRIRRGEYRQGLELAEAILLLDKRMPGSWELRRLIKRARERLVSREILEPMLDSKQLVYEVGQKPELTFRIANRDTRVARILLDRGVLGEMDMVVTRRYLNGTMRRELNKLKIQGPEQADRIIIGPGQVWEYPIQFDAGEGFDPQGMVARVQVAGRFRPTRWTVEREQENITISMNSTEFWLVPPGEAVLCERPLEKLTAAMFFGKLQPFFVAGQLSVWVGEEDPYFNEKLVATLMESLEELPPPLQTLTGRFLEQATGHRFGEDVERWRGWWEGVQGRPAEKAPTPEDEPLIPEPVETPGSGSSEPGG